jgi:general secretion pathway protein C
VACAYLLAEITWLFFPQQDEQVVSVKHSTITQNNNQSQQASFRKMTSSNLFGVTEKATVATTKKAPETRLNLTLKGVLAATPEKLATAIIAQGKSGKEEIYGVGDRIPGGVTIREIHPEYVMLERNGQLETLKLQKDNDIGNISSTGLNNLRQSSDRRSKSPGSVLKEIRENIIKNPTSFGEYALPIVVRENGKQVGYRLKPQQKGDLLSEVGLQDNDVITQINGVKLDNPQNGISALRKLSNATNLNVVVRRGGIEVPLYISLQ